MVGSGPFVFDQHVTGQYISFHANPNYWAGAPHIKNLVFRIFQSEDTMVAALKKGEIDFADNLGATSFKSLKNVKGITTVPAEYSGFDELAFNTGAATDNGVPIGDGNPSSRTSGSGRRSTTPIDSKTLVDKVLGGYGEVGTSIIPDDLREHPLRPGRQTRNFDPAKANQILDDAGYTKGADGIRVGTRRASR